MAAENVCQRNKYGFCKFRQVCRKQHITEKCENLNCEIENCLQRHPQECRYFRSYGRCKFSEFCFYEHKVGDKTTPRNEFEKVTAKLEDFATRFQEKEERLDAVEKISERQIEEAKDLRNELEEKSAQIKLLENKIEKLSETLLKCKPFTEPEDEIQKEVVSPSENKHTKEDLVKQMLDATTESIQIATVAAIAQFAARQDAHEQKINSQFGVIEHQLDALLPTLRQLSIPEPAIKFPCNFCGQNFEIERSLQNHIRRNHNPNLT